MADLTANFAGISSPNPFWLASAPPTDKVYNVARAFKAGWGGVVWKTLGEDPPIVNVSSRYGGVSYNGTRIAGFSNIELITDRPLQVNLDEIKQIKRDWPGRAVVVSLMVPCTESSWRSILARVEDTGCDGVELNFGCPHGMSERDMGSAVGQVPEYVEMVTRWCKQHTRMPVIVKLTPNVTDILAPAAAARRGGADGVSLINTLQAITGVDLDLMAPEPVVDGQGSHGGYCGPAVKPIALRMVADIARAMPDLPVSGIGGISAWRDAAEFIALGAANVQVCTAAMHRGFKIVEDMIDGLRNWMDDKSWPSIEAMRARAIRNYVHWSDLNLNYKTVARIDQDLCIKCGLCHIGCEDTSHQAISALRVNGHRRYEVIDAECVGCNLCFLACPVDGCITMVRQDTGAAVLTWDHHPNNPLREEFSLMSTSVGNIAIDGERMWATIMETAQIGGTPKGGIRRLTLTDLDRQVRDWFRAACEAAGCTINIDDMGNIFARRPGRDPTLPPIAIGSHLDTQPTGGKYDGVIGVLAGLEVLRTLNDQGYETNAPIEVIDWTNEEGSRFAPAMLSSGVFAGVFDTNYAYARQDREGQRLGDELTRIGYKGDVKCGSHKLGAHFELHIEQGPILEAEAKTIGVVTGVQGMRWYEVTVTGNESHAGSTPMRLRRDALVGASRMVAAINDVAWKFAPDAVATVGLIESQPNSRNVVPGSVFFTIDLRHPDDAVVAAMEAKADEALRQIADEAGLEIVIERVWDSPAVRFDPDCIASVRRAAELAGYPSREIVSGAGHDSAYIARVAPTTMVFVPCEKGLSHNEAEHAEKTDVVAGANVLLRAVLETDQRLAERASRAG